jgi:hypothetical protein
MIAVHEIVPLQPSSFIGHCQVGARWDREQVQQDGSRRDRRPRRELTRYTSCPRPGRDGARAFHREDAARPTETSASSQVDDRVDGQYVYLDVDQHDPGRVTWAFDEDGQASKIFRTGDPGDGYEPPDGDVHIDSGT